MGRTPVILRLSWSQGAARMLSRRDPRLRGGRWGRLRCSRRL